MVASESTYSALEATGEVPYHDGYQATDFFLFYQLPDDWLFPESIGEYKARRDEQRRRRAMPPLDSRQVLYGAALNVFIVRECLAAKGQAATAPVPENLKSQPDDSQFEYEEVIGEIHARWLMTPRQDLLGQNPREVLLKKQNFIDLDLQSREVQWSLLGEGPPPLARDSYAYRFAGFGTHEIVLYYDLLRHMLRACWKRVQAEESIDAVAEAAILEKLKQSWLHEPQPEFDGRIPSAIIESERRRIPLAMSAKEIIIDEDCELCRMMADESEGFGPTFWHLDGSDMDPAFEFSNYRTREEWETEQRRWSKFSEEFADKWALQHGKETGQSPGEELGEFNSEGL
jgi:hypothetical protein